MAIQSLPYFLDFPLTCPLFLSLWSQISSLFLPSPFTLFVRMLFYFLVEIYEENAGGDTGGGEKAGDVVSHVVHRDAILVLRYFMCIYSAGGALSDGCHVT